MSHTLDLESLFLSVPADVFRHVRFGVLREFMKELEAHQVPIGLGANMGLDSGGDVITRTHQRRLQVFDPSHGS